MQMLHRTNGDDLPARKGHRTSRNPLATICHRTNRKNPQGQMSHSKKSSVQNRTQDETETPTQGSYDPNQPCAGRAGVEYLNSRGLPEGTGSHHGLALHVRERIRPRRSTPTQEGTAPEVGQRPHEPSRGREALRCECGSTPRTQRRSASDLRRTTPEADTAQHDVTAAAADT